MNHNGNSPMPSPEITWIDLEKWPRRTHFESFTTYSRCMIHASAKIDVTALHGACKATGRRFYPAMIVLAAGAANAIPEFRMVLSPERKPGTWNFVSPVYTTWHDDDKTFSSICTEYDPSPARLYDAVVRDMERYKDAKGHIVTPVPPNILPISCEPELAFDSFCVQPCGESVYGESVAPTLIWGRYVPGQDGRLLLPVSVSIHHAAADGWHIARFFRELQARCDAPDALSRPEGASLS